MITEILTALADELEDHAFFSPEAIPVASLDIATDKLTATEHGLATGAMVLISLATGAVLPASEPQLALNTGYFVRRIDKDTITLHQAAVAATAGTGAINFTRTGTGVMSLGLRPIPVVGENKRDVLNLVEQSVAKLGLCVIVGFSEGAVKSSNIPGPRFDEMVFIAAVHEIVPVNRGIAGTGVTAIEAAEAVAAVLHLKKLKNFSSVIRVAGINEASTERTLAYQVRLLMAGGLDPKQQPTRS